jgi:DNA-binding response OmpR family regulator
MQDSQESQKPRGALVVEDDEQIARLIRFILEREGYKVEVATDGAAAQRIVSTMPPPAIVTLDVMIPAVDGFGVLKTIRDDAAWRDVPVLMMSAKSQDKDIARALEAGATDYIIKPFKPDDLRSRVRRMIAPAS